MRRSLILVNAAAVVALLGNRAGAQVQRPIELGIDAGASIGLDNPKVTTISIPAQSFRVGFFVADNLSIEPAVGIFSQSTGGNTGTVYRGELGLLLHFGGIRPSTGAYVRPFAGFEGVSGGGTSATNGLVGGGIGYKIPLIDRFAARFEANFQHVFVSGGGGANAIGLLAGLSFFTR